MEAVPSSEGGGEVNQSLKSLKTLLFDLPRYIHGDLHPFRHRTAPTVPRLLFGERKWISMERWSMPRFECSVMNGHGEHYGYPRHHCYLLLWWNRRGYAFGCEWSKEITK